MIDAYPIRQLEERGYKGRIVPIRYLYDLQEEIERHYTQGLLDKEFYREWLTAFSFGIPDDLPEANSLIVVAIPQPQFQVVFTWNEKPLPVLVPPTYLHDRKTDQQVKDALTEILGPEGYYRVAQAALPNKLLAVRSGLAAYGKNNITYVTGMGSFYRLAVFFSDLACQEDRWQKAKMMPSCENCSACLRNCPTGAISSERFLLHAERCITLHNEQPGDVPFPAWIDPLWHNCLVGCMRCQDVCPPNRDFRPWVENGAEFSEEETARLLEGISLDHLPATTVEKLAQLGLDEYADVLPRNLNALLRGGC